MTHKLKCNFLCAVIILLIQSFIGVSAAHARDDFTVMSWNILREGLSEDTCPWPQRKDSVKAVVQTVNPDIIGIQEADMGVRELEDVFEGYTLISERSSSNRAPLLSYILYKPEVFTLESYEYRLIDNDYRSASATLVHKATGKRVHVYSLHQRCCNGQERRSEEFTALWQQIGHLSNEPMILLGDFNENPGEEVAQRMLSLGFQDAFAHIHGYGEEVPVGGFSGEGCSVRDPSRPFDFALFRIDYIFVKNLFVLDSGHEASAPLGVYPSDHPYVRARVQFDEPVPPSPSPQPSPSPEPSPTCAHNPDVDRDGRISIFDYNVIVASFGSQVTQSNKSADINCSGYIDIFDYNALVSRFTAS